MNKFTLEVKLLDEAGYFPALFGLSTNKHHDEKNLGILRKMKNVAENLAPLDRGHNKFLEHIYVWLQVKAPRYWWQEADTYRISSKQSESTRHTVKVEVGLTQDRFEEDIPEDYLIYLNNKFQSYKRKEIKVHEWQRYMPEGFLQTREWCMSYKTLRNIIDQRSVHPFPHWNSFCEQVLNQVEHPEFLKKKEKNEN